MRGAFVRVTRLICLTVALSAAASAAGSEYQERRQALSKALPRSVIVLFGRSAGSDDLSRFFQEPNFYYLTGWKQQGALVLIDPSREVLFLPQHDPDHEKWTGPQAAPGDADISRVTGFDSVLPVERFESELHASLDRWRTLYTVGDQARAQLRAFAPLRDVADPSREIARLRMKKSQQELALLQRAADATIAAHRAAWKQAVPGVYEYQVAAGMVAVYAGLGCERSAYPPIVGSGPNSVYLHYEVNERRMDRGEILLVDVGAECAGYAADVTRTVPVGGKFSTRQREIYEIVLGAQKAAIAAAKPGVTVGNKTPNSLYKVAYDYINSHGKDLHGESLGKYFTHGIGHHVGLEVHDASDTTAPLEEGMVITIEPGIYIPEENIGIRLEDMVLITKQGARVLTAALPREAGDIEKALAP
ncbi:MAG: peptidase M24 [Terriglobia bacterium]|nr:MAG: peptidase M24 [Terriglobia bacterium]